MINPSVRELILQNIETTLKKIDMSEGYHNSVYAKNISRLVKAATPLDIKQFPTLYILTGPDDPLEEGSQSNYGVTLYRFRIGILACVDSDDVRELPKAVEDILADARKVMNVDPTRGGYAIDTNDAGALQPILNEVTAPSAFIEIGFDILYRTKRGDPATIV